MNGNTGRKTVFDKQISRLHYRINLIQRQISLHTFLPADIDLTALDRHLRDTFAQFYYIETTLKTKSTSNHGRLSFMDDLEKLRSNLKLILFMLGQKTDLFSLEDEEDLRFDLQDFAEHLINDPSSGLTEKEKKQIPGLMDENGLMRKRSVRFLSEFCLKRARMKVDRIEVLANLFTNS